MKLFLDFETYWDMNYTLRKMTPAEYAMDTRFEALGAGFIQDDEKPFWVDGDRLDMFFVGLPWDQIEMISHNALFDAFILSHRYGKRPRRVYDTLAMARAWCFHFVGSNALDPVAQYYGCAPKMGTVTKTVGLNFHAVRKNSALYAELKTYGKDDVSKCKTIFDSIMAQGFPPEQLEVMDMITKMATAPAFVLDETLLHQHLATVVAKKQALLAKAGLTDRKALLSDDLLALMLMNEGVVAPSKLSPATGKKTYAFAKTDEQFTKLLEHENPDVQAIVAARLGFKSTLEETRTQRFINISRIDWLWDTPPKTMPIPLNFSGAHTHRASGAWSLNVQNLGRASPLRDAILAPPGYDVVSCDASQIEARMLAVFAGQSNLVESFRAGRDVYCEFATEVYNRLITPESNMERQVGKIGILSLGYGASDVAFQAMIAAQTAGTVPMTDAMAQLVVTKYRNKYTRIVSLWNWCTDLIPMLAHGQGLPPRLGCLELRKNEIILPNGMKLRYHDLNYGPDKDGYPAWTYKFGKMRKKLYGSKLVENIIQALAFVHIMEAALRVKKITGDRLYPKHQVHDELLYVVPQSISSDVGELLRIECSRSPAWMPDAPLAAKWGKGASYGQIDK